LSERHGVDTQLTAPVRLRLGTGSFEVPAVARQLAPTHRYDAIICSGAVIRGQTPHFDYVAAEVAKGIAVAGFRLGNFGILTADTTAF